MEVLDGSADPRGTHGDVLDGSADHRGTCGEVLDGSGDHRGRSGMSRGTFIKVRDGSVDPVEVWDELGDLR